MPTKASTAPRPCAVHALLTGLGLAWMEEPLPAEDVSGHRQLREHTTIPVAVGESMYHPMQFREYLEQGACSIVQPDVARIGGITPWIKTAHLAETFDVAVCPHFLMELHVSLCAAVPNATWVEYIPQLDDITTSRMQVQDGFALPPDTPGLGIAWDWAAISRNDKSPIWRSKPHETQRKNRAGHRRWPRHWPSRSTGHGG